MNSQQTITSNIISARFQSMGAQVTTADANGSAKAYDVSYCGRAFKLWVYRSGKILLQSVLDRNCARTVSAAVEMLQHSR